MTPAALPAIHVANQHGIETVTKALLELIGEDTTREGLRDTPARVARFWAEFLNPKPFNPTAFDAERAGGTDPVVQIGIPFYSLCEHHLLPFFGTAIVGYMPAGKILGLSKLARLVQFTASRPQNQERITSQVAEALVGLTGSTAVLVRLEARHLCMEMRGVKAPGTSTVTQAERGVNLGHISQLAEIVRDRHR